MSTNTFTASSFNPARASTAAGVLRELFQATPLYILAVALRTAARKPGQR